MEVDVWEERRKENIGMHISFVRTERENIFSYVSLNLNKISKTSKLKYQEFGT